MLLAAAALGGCAAGREPAEPEPPQSAATGLPLGELPAQTLTRGQCALVLWARTSPPHRIFLALNTPAAARVRLGDRTVTLPRTRVGGAETFGHHPVQIYEGEGLTLTAVTEFETREGLTGGAAAPNATVTVRGADGLETVIAAAGLLACQSYRPIGP